jgi:DNA-directed RNA polymerase specialized sigma24 family protein
MIHWAGGGSIDAEDVVHRGLEKFITQMRARPETFTGFAGMASLMTYLKRCVRSVRIDRQRKAEREQRVVEALEITVSAHARSSEALVLDPLVRERCAEHIQSRLKDEQERLLVHLQFELDVKPAEIVERCPDQFPDADEVYKVRERIIRRLSRDLVLEDLWTDRVEKPD